jgi:glucan phosphoethanolaminetransferase (alkaline phosphatase superfamily)
MKQKETNQKKIKLLTSYAIFVLIEGFENWIKKTNFDFRHLYFLLPMVVIFVFLVFFFLRNIKANGH